MTRLTDADSILFDSILLCSANDGGVAAAPLHMKRACCPETHKIFRHEAKPWLDKKLQRWNHVP